MRVATVLVMVALVLVGCGGDGDSETTESTSVTTTTTSSSGTDSTTTSTAPTDTTALPGTDVGSGTLAVDGKTLEVSIFFCGFGPDETGNDNVPFSMRGSGTDDGKPFTIDGAIITVNRDTSSLSMWYDEDPLTLIYETGILSQAEYEIEGKDVSLTASFMGADGSSVGESTFNGMCP